MKDLFEPCSLAGLQLKNRWAMAPMTRGRCPGGIPTEAVSEHYGKRARGGIGLIITEGVLIDHPLANAYGEVPFLGDDSLDAWRRVITEAHAYNTLVFPQIWHCGPYSRPGVAGYPVEESGRTVVHKATGKDKEELLQAYGKAASNTIKAGFDGLELHGAHGYLLDSFLRSGDVAYVVEVIRETRLQTSPDFPICLRFSNFKAGDYDTRYLGSPTELENLLMPLIDAGVDILHPSTRRFWIPEFAENERSLAWWTRKISGLPTMIVGNIGLKKEEFSGEGPGSLANLQRMLDEEEFDIAAVGRPLISEPEWVNKVKTGDWDQVTDFYESAIQEIYP